MGTKAREKTNPGESSTRIPEAIDRLPELYTATNKPDEVKNYKELRAKYPTPNELAPLPREAAGIEYRGSDGRLADFYALGHRFITEMAKAGEHPKDSMELARHSTITLTIDRYSHVELRDSAAALSKLNLGTVVAVAGTVELAATGTDNRFPLTPVSDKPRLRLKTDEKTSNFLPKTSPIRNL